jgi:LPXTG-site transpeptidase (sortase) family protein
VRALRLTGNLLIGGCVFGLLALAVVLVVPEGPASSPWPNLAGLSIPWSNNGAAAGRAGFAPLEGRSSPPGGNTAAAASRLQGEDNGVDLGHRGAGAVTTSDGNAGDGTAVGRSTADPNDNIRLPITRVVIPSIDLSAEVVPADVVAVDGGFTWEVPAFKIGHAETTAGAGQVGNAVLLGHVTSLRSGNVFAELDRVSIGDTVRVFSDADEFQYVVVSTTSVSRSDSSVLQPTDVPSISLITCTGMWLPTIWDYTERLVVHAERSQ